jgi:FtsZ-binding cell division protein ZapB
MSGITSPTRTARSATTRVPAKKVGNIIAQFEKKKEDEQINALIIDKLKNDAKERKVLGLPTPRNPIQATGHAATHQVATEQLLEKDDSLTQRVQDIRKNFEKFQKMHEEKKKKIPMEQSAVKTENKAPLPLPVEGERTLSDESMSVHTHTTSSGSFETKNGPQEDEDQEFDAELFNHWYDNIMCYPPPALMKGLFGSEVSAKADAANIGEGNDEREINEDVRWSRPTPGSAKKLKVGELDLLNAYKRKSILYTQNNPDEVRVNPFFFNSSIHLNPNNGDHEDPHAMGWDDDYESDDDMYDEREDDRHEPKMARMVGFENDETFLKWEREMEERATQVHFRT